MLLPAIIGLLVGILLGLSGAGGGVLAIPLLCLLGGWALEEAIRASLIGVGAIALAATVANALRGRLAWRLALPVSALAILGAPAGAALGLMLPERVRSTLFVALGLLVAWSMWRGGCQGRPPDQDPVEAPESRRITPVALLAGALTGLLAGLFGVGGGFILVPALVMSGLAMASAATVSLLAIALSSAAAIAGRLALPDAGMPWLAGILLAGAGIPAWFLGDRLGRRLRPCRLKETVSASLALVLMLMLVDQLRAH